MPKSEILMCLFAPTRQFLKTVKITLLPFNPIFCYAFYVYANVYIYQGFPLVLDFVCNVLLARERGKERDASQREGSPKTTTLSKNEKRFAPHGKQLSRFSFTDFENWRRMRLVVGLMEDNVSRTISGTVVHDTARSVSSSNHNNNI